MLSEKLRGITIGQFASQLFPINGNINRSMIDATMNEQSCSNKNQNQQVIQRRQLQQQQEHQQHQQQQQQQQNPPHHYQHYSAENIDEKSTSNNLVLEKEDLKDVQQKKLKEEIHEAHDAAFSKRGYRLGPEIGRGGFGVVYSGIRLETMQPVAIKYVSRRNVTYWTTVRGHEVPLEIALLEQCKNCRGVIKLIEWFERPDGFLIVMERPTSFIDLFDYISDRGFLSEVVTRCFFKQIVETAIACADCSVVHCDIKDENLIIDMTTGDLLLIDFGSGAFLKNEEYTDFEGVV